MIFFTSDTHFCHTKVIPYCKRPFKSVEEMNEALVTNFNKIVKKEDTVYHLGDAGFGDKDRVLSILKRLNGKKHLIRGNHDHTLLKGLKGKAIQGIFLSINHYLEVVYKDFVFILCHYPMVSWNRAKYGSIMLHGHCHGTIDVMNIGIRRMDVGVDSNKFCPIDIDSIMEKCSKIAPIVPNKEDDEEDM